MGSYVPAYIGAGIVAAIGLVVLLKALPKKI